MPIELKIPEIGESITSVEIGEWLKAEGERVARDENLVVIESEKTTFELPAPAAGILAKIVKQQGQTAAVGEVIGLIEAAPEVGRTEAAPAERDSEKERQAEPARERPEPAFAGPTRVMPAARRALAETGQEAAEVEPTGPGGRLLKEDVLRAATAREPQPGAPEPRVTAARGERAVAMSPIRRRIAERLVAAQQNAALLTTFNEIDMSAVAALRATYQPVFQERYGIRLGLMSFFVKAAIDGLRLVPEVNAEIRGSQIVYHDYYDIGVAVGSGRGLVVPVLRNADAMSFAEIEVAIDDFARRAREGKIKLEELQGGTFTISNGGIYGSLLSTPIVNPPQSGILGMHVIQDRPVVRDGTVVVRPMMYVALTYDHRIVDGREAVTFLRRIKESIEEPARMLLAI